MLIDLKTTGINIRPIKTLAGDEEFAEVFFDDVRVPMENLVGDLHDGWRVANALLAHERLGTANPQLLFEAIERVKSRRSDRGGGRSVFSRTPCRARHRYRRFRGHVRPRGEDRQC